MAGNDLFTRGTWGEILLPPGKDTWAYLLQAAREEGLVDEVATGLLEAIQAGEMVRLPDGCGPQEQIGFAPVMRYLGGMAWLVGLSGQGRLEYLVAKDAGDAVAQAQDAYLRLVRRG